jgi:hypothetical protein
MRTIKFRGLRVDGQGWAYGDYMTNGGGAEIRAHYSNCFGDFECYEVIPESVGQFTGLIDIEVKKIYEGDKLSAGESVVIIQHKGRGFEGEFINKSQFHEDPVQNNNYLHWKIIGNIHEK